MTSAQQSTEADTEKEEDPPPLLPGCHDPTPSNWSLQIGHLEHASEVGPHIMLDSLHKSQLYQYGNPYINLPYERKIIWDYEN